jgi:hypothetical protein
LSKKPASLICYCIPDYYRAAWPGLLAAWPGLLAAMARPVNRWAYGEQDLANLAGILLLGIGVNHPFQQGNKRTALTAAKVFLQFNGYSFVAPDSEPWAHWSSGPSPE